MRTFDTGATRSSDTGKYDFEGFLSPRVLARFAEYMHEHRVEEGGAIRDSDNWQKGMPVEQYMKSLIRHVMDAWMIHRGVEVNAVVNGNSRPQGPMVTFEDSLLAVMFNTMGILHELLRGSTFHREGSQ